MTSLVDCIPSEIVDEVNKIPCSTQGLAANIARDELSDTNLAQSRANSLSLLSIQHRVVDFPARIDLHWLHVEIVVWYVMTSGEVIRQMRVNAPRGSEI